MSAEHECLEGKHECLQPEDQRVHQAEGINGMKCDRPEGACVFAVRQRMSRTYSKESRPHPALL